MTVDGDAFKNALRTLPMAVVVVTARGNDGVRGLTAGSFSSVSLDPPLVGFNVMKSSSVLASLQESDRFVVTILAEDQVGLANRFARPGLGEREQLEGVGWSADPASGVPRLDGAVAWLSCRRTHLYEAGDHSIVVGEVVSAETGRQAPPLLYFQGGYRKIGNPVDAG